MTIGAHDVDASYDFTAFVSALHDVCAHLPADADLYELADRICIAYALGVAPDGEWADRLLELRADDGLFVERTPSHHPWHATAFAVAALELVDRTPSGVPALDRYRDPNVTIEFLEQLDWRTGVYLGSHEGAGLLSIAAIVPGFIEPPWFDDVCGWIDARVDPANGMLGVDKPPAGDLDQIGGTFHYHFVHEHLGRHLPYVPERIDAVLGMQRDDGIWHPLNPAWLTLDAVYLCTHDVGTPAHRRDDVTASVHRTLVACRDDLCAPTGLPTRLAGPLGPHTGTALVHLLAEAQRHLGADLVVTDEPLRSVLDRRPFI